MIAEQLKNIVAWDWMRPELATIQADSSVEEAVVRMRKLGIHHLVVMKGKEPVGMLDAQACAGIWDPAEKVNAVMQSNVAIIDETTEIREVVDLILHQRSTALLLKRAGTITGVITSTDLLKLLSILLKPEAELSESIAKCANALAKPAVQTFVRLLEQVGL